MDHNNYYRPQSAPPILQNTPHPYEVPYSANHPHNSSNEDYHSSYEYYRYWANNPTNPRLPPPTRDWHEQFMIEQQQMRANYSRGWGFPTQTPFGPYHPPMNMGNGTINNREHRHAGYTAIQQDFPRTESPPVDSRKYVTDASSPISPPQNRFNENDISDDNQNAPKLNALPIKRSVSRDSENSVTAPFFGLPPIGVQRTYSNGSNPSLTPLGVSRSLSNASNSSGYFNGKFVPRDAVPASPVPPFPGYYTSPTRGPSNYTDAIPIEMVKREHFTAYHRSPMNNINAVCGEGAMYTASYDVIPMPGVATQSHHYMNFRRNHEYPSNTPMISPDTHESGWVAESMANSLNRTNRKHEAMTNGYTQESNTMQKILNGNTSNGINTVNGSNSNSRSNRSRRRNNRSDSDDSDVDIRQFMRNNPTLKDLVIERLIIKFACDQLGSRFIQTCLEQATREEKDAVFKQIYPETLRLCTDVFGNYVVQKFFEYGNEPHKIKLASSLMTRVLPLSLSMYGCRVVQKALECVNDHLKITLIEELRGSVEKCVRDQNGNHVIQKCIEEVPEKHLDFITETFIGKVYEFSTHPYGCRVIQRLLEHCTNSNDGPTNPHHNAILDEIKNHVLALAKDQYGNYVVQHVLSHGPRSARLHIVNTVEGHLLALSKHKFASNVVEKSFMYARDEAQRDRLLDEVMGTIDDSPLVSMVRDQYANYVVQKILEVINDNQRHRLVKMITAVVPQLRKFIYGKHIINKIEQLTGKNVD